MVVNYHVWGKVTVTATLVKRNLGFNEETPSEQQAQNSDGVAALTLLTVVIPMM